MYLVIFDCDGTLVDSQETILHGLEVGFDAAGLKMPDRRTALSIVGLSLERAFLTLVGEKNAGHVTKMADAYRASKVARRQQGLDFDPLYPGTREVLDRLAERDDILLGIATGKARRGVDHLLEVHDLGGRFVTIQTADTSPSKPHPDMVYQAMEETGADAGSTVVIGDTSFDMEMAVSAGAQGVGVTWGYHDRERLIAGGAAHVIDHFDQLDAVIGSLFDLDRETA